MHAKRKFIGLALAGAIALGGVGILVSASGKDSGASSSKIREVDVLVAAAPLANGVDPTAETTKSSLALAHMRVEDVAPDALRSAQELQTLQGLRLSRPLAAGDQIVRSAFAKTTSYADATAPVDVPADLLQQSFTLEAQRVLGGRLRPGDHVGVMFSYTGGGAGGEQGGGATHLVLSKVLVANVQAEQLPSNPGAANAADAESLAQTMTGNLTVTLALDAPSAEKLTHGLEFGKLWLVVQPVEAPDGGTAVQTIGSVLSGSATVAVVKP